LTHGFVPYAAFTIARRPRVERIAAAIGGIAPDMDAVWAWLSHSHEHAYPLVHRGFSHTFWGAPLLATVLLFFVAHRKIAGRFRRFENIWFTRGAFIPLWIGAWSHLLLDGLTITGIPLLWPFFDGRFTTDWFFFGIPYLLPLSLFGWIMIYRGKATDRVVKRVFALMVVVLLLAGSVRAYSYPRDLTGDEDVTPGPVDWMWIVSSRNDTGVHVYSTGWEGKIGPSVFFEDSAYGAPPHVRSACEETVGYVPWRWYMWGIPVTRATHVTVHGGVTTRETVGGPTEDGVGGEEFVNGTWIVAYHDSALLFNERYPTFRLWQNPVRNANDSEEGGICTWTPSGNVKFQRARGWIGS